MNLDFLNDAVKPWKTTPEHLSTVLLPPYAGEETADAINKWNTDNETLIVEKAAIATGLADLKRDLLEGKNTGPTFRENRRALLAKETDNLIAEWRLLGRKDSITELMGQDYARAGQKAKDVLATETAKVRTVLVDLNGDPAVDSESQRAIQTGLRDHPQLMRLRAEVERFSGRYPEAVSEDDRIRGRAIHAKLCKLI